MFSVPELSERIEAIRAREMSLEDFENWFLSESWGHYDVSGGRLSNAIAVVQNILHSCERGELPEGRVAEELAEAIRPFEPQQQTCADISVSAVPFPPAGNSNIGSNYFTYAA